MIPLYEITYGIVRYDHLTLFEILVNIFPAFLASQLSTWDSSNNGIFEKFAITNFQKPWELHVDNWDGRNIRKLWAKVSNEIKQLYLIIPDLISYKWTKWICKTVYRNAYPEIINQHHLFKLKEGRVVSSVNLHFTVRFWNLIKSDIKGRMIRNGWWSSLTLLMCQSLKKKSRRVRSSIIIPTKKKGYVTVFEHENLLLFQKSLPALLILVACKNE